MEERKRRGKRKNGKGMGKILEGIKKKRGEEERGGEEQEK